MIQKLCFHARLIVQLLKRSFYPFLYSFFTKSLSRLFAICCLFVLLCLLTSCALQPCNSKKVVFVDSSIGDASYLNPLLASDSASGDINNLIFNGLVKYDKDLNLIGDLAESWSVYDGGMVIVFKLRKNIRWHDGEPFTAADVEYTYKKLIDPAVKTPYGSDYKLVKRFSVLNEYMVRIEYDTPFAPALESWGMGIIPQHIYQDGDFNSHPANRKPIGTGPFVFKEWKTDQKIILEANKDYFEGKPGIDRYVYRIIPDQSVQFLELRNQSIDMMGLTPDMYNAYQEFFVHYNKFKYPSFSYTFMGMNLKRPVFKDQRIRQALAYAINKQELIQGILLGYGQEATGPFPPSSWAYNPDVKGFSYNPEKAHALLKECGFADENNDGILEKDGAPFRFVLMTNQGNKIRELCAQIIQSQLKKIGIQIDIRIIEWSTFIHTFINKRDFDAIILGWNLSRDPDAYSIWHSSQQGESQYNFISYKNPLVDDLLVRARTEFDREKRKMYYYRIHELITNDAPYIFLYYPEALPVVHKRFIGPEVAAAGLGWNFREWHLAEKTKDALQP